jgi:7-cyano-7-deazaguanine synthase
MAGIAERDASALVLFSGGQDSTTCLAWALDRYAHVETIGFFYGQRHRVELDCRPPILERLGAVYPGRLGADHFLDIEAGLKALGGTAMTEAVAITMGADGLPSTFVPGRNLLFFTYAAALAYRRGITRLVGGMCETDYSGYPDCRDDTLKALQVAINLGTARRFVVETPLMWLDKAETWALADRLGGADLIAVIRELTHTCYLGQREPLHDWGRGCGACPACELRRNGYDVWTGAAEEDSSKPCV